MRNVTAQVLWWAMAINGVLVAVYAIGVLLVPVVRAPFVSERLIRMPLAVYAHLSGGAIAAGIGWLQFDASLRERRLSLHRWLGRTYLIAVLIGGVGGLALAPVSQAGMVSHLGFGTLAVLWLFTGGRGYQQIRAEDEIGHRRWMIRNYALTYAAVTLRFLLGPALALGAPFGIAYPAISWVCWVPNLLIAEWLFVRPAGLSRRPPAETEERLRSGR
jgi:hypothetical protein